LTGYDAVLSDTIDSLETTVESCTSFNSDSVHFDYVRTIYYDETDPVCLLSLIRDVAEAIGPYETRHLFTFQAKISHQGTGTKANLKEITGYVGEIIDKIETDRTLGGSYIARTEASVVEYSQNAPQNFIRYFAFMGIEVEVVRNTA